MRKSFSSVYVYQNCANGFVLQCRRVSMEVNESAQEVPPRAGADPQQTIVLLLAVFSQAVSPDNTSTMFARVPWLVDSVCHLIGAYAGWFAGPLTAVLDPGMRYVLASLHLSLSLSLSPSLSLSLSLFVSSSLLQRLSDGLRPIGAGV